MTGDGLSLFVDCVRLAGELLRVAVVIVVVRFGMAMVEVLRVGGRVLGEGGPVSLSEGSRGLWPTLVGVLPLSQGSFLIVLRGVAIGSFVPVFTLEFKMNFFDSLSTPDTIVTVQGDKSKLLGVQCSAVYLWNLRLLAWEVNERVVVRFWYVGLCTEKISQLQRMSKIFQVEKLTEGLNAKNR